MTNAFTIAKDYQALLPKLEQGLTSLKLPLSDLKKQQLLYYLQQLLFWNKAYNLTAIKQAEPALTKHILDSLAIVPYLPDGSLLDIGTGAGLPAVIVAICQPQRAVTALDSNSKKVRFIKQIVSELGLKNVTPLASRIEEHDGKYHIVTSRAFSSLVDFVALGQDKLSEGGEFWAMKGVNPVQEIAQLQAEWQINSIELSVPFLQEERHLIQLKK